MDKSLPKTETDHGSFTLASNSESKVFDDFWNHYNQSPVPQSEAMANLGMFLTSKNLSRILFFHEIYQKILHHHGVAIEFGVRWGQNLALLSALRGIYEPFNRHRKIIGFDTFAGFRGAGPEDGNASGCSDGSFAVTPNFKDYLDKLITLHDATNPISHIKKFELVEGDASETVPAYLAKHPETIVSLAIFDFDIYKPTRDALQALLPHLCKGSVLVFDELCDEYFPGETIALREVLGLRNLHIQRSPNAARVSYVVLD
jgi:hypothetical protein